MRKFYSKPEIFFEDFSLSTSITVGCDVQTHTPSKDQCGIYVEGVGNLFLTTIAGCNGEGGFPVEFDNYNGICYHVPLDTNNLFNS